MFLSPQKQKSQKTQKIEIQADLSFQDRNYIPKNFQTKFKKSFKITTFPRTSASPKSKTFANSINSLSYVYKPQHIQSKSFKLPAVSDLLNLSFKY